MDINLKINDVPVLGTIKMDGITYYVDRNKFIYTLDNNTYNKVTDASTLKRILEYITPRSLDVI